MKVSIFSQGLISLGIVLIERFLYFNTSFIGRISYFTQKILLSSSIFVLRVLIACFSNISSRICLAFFSSLSLTI